MKRILFFGAVLGLTVLLSGFAFLFGFGLHSIGSEIRERETGGSLLENLKRTSLLDRFGGKDGADLTAAASSGDEIVIPATRRGNHLYVDVEINDEQTVTLMVDTGATDISLTSVIARELGLSEDQSGKATYNTANGPTQRYVTSLESIRIGGILHQNVEASFGEGLEDGFMDGLLGMSVLKYYIVNIDLVREELHLIPRQT